jgi:1,2-phenylacetyl-CoA epoxidase catalytic subunit
MKIYMIESYYKTRMSNGSENWCYNFYINKQVAEERKKYIEETREDIDRVCLSAHDINDLHDDVCNCKHKMELQFVCENCGIRKSV